MMANTRTDSHAFFELLMYPGDIHEPQHLFQMHHAGRPLGVDDASVNDKGAGHVEAWVARDSAKNTVVNLGAWAAEGTSAAS
jgi:hypothetical protein